MATNMLSSFATATHRLDTSLAEKPHYEIWTCTDDTNATQTRTDRARMSSELALPDTASSMICIYDRWDVLCLCSWQKTLSSSQPAKSKLYVDHRNMYTIFQVYIRVCVCEFRMLDRIACVCVFARAYYTKHNNQRKTTSAATYITIPNVYITSCNVFHVVRRTLLRTFSARSHKRSPTHAHTQTHTRKLYYSP